MLALLLSTAVILPAQRGTPFRYGHRWSLGSFGGVELFDDDFSGAFLDHYMAAEFFSPLAGIYLSYNVTDGYELRFSANYSRKSGVVPPQYGFLSYSFRSVNAFADFVTNYRGLGEYFSAFNPKLYIGTGVSYTYDFHKSWIDGEGMPVVRSRNVAPSIHFGMVIEYNFRSGFGLIFDLGLASYLDPYNGLGFISFPFDFEIDNWFGIVYHFKLPQKK
ncbi:MAG: hypothetical protein IKS47_05800 [Bacteroidales bacterium]|nr:hypothetical protein [Bacteroidales bacterium]